MDSLVTLVCLIGIVSAIFTICLNCNLVAKIVCRRGKRTDEMMLFYYRFTLDIFFGLALANYIIYVLLSIHLPPKSMSSLRILIIWLAIPWSMLGACRSIVALSISIERVFAVYFPIKYIAKRRKVPNGAILVLGAVYACCEPVVLFGLCDYDFGVSESCRVFGCAINSCFHTYWTESRAIVFLAIILLSGLLSAKLLVWRALGRQTSDRKSYSRANRLALLDTFTVVFFDFLPSFCGNIWKTTPMFSFDYVGPYNAVCKVIGCGIESVVVSSLLIRNAKRTGTGKAKNSDEHYTSRFFELKKPKHQMNTSHIIQLY